MNLTPMFTEEQFMKIVCSYPVLHIIFSSIIFKLKTKIDLEIHIDV